MQPDNTVKVYVETPDVHDGFHNAWCILPQYEWKDINGCSEREVAKYQEIIESLSYLIMEFTPERI
jgi:hypothetical protein